MDLDRAQAEWTLGCYCLRSEELPELAAQMMLSGFEGPAILELVSYHRPMLSELPEGLVDRAFRETGRPPLTKTKAALVLAEPAARLAVYDGQSPYVAALKALWNVPWGEEDDAMSCFYRLDELVELWEEYPFDRGEWERLLLEALRDLLKQRNNP